MSATFSTASRDLREQWHASRGGGPGSLGRTGYEPVAELEADAGLRDQVSAAAAGSGRAMGLGDVREATIPKVSLIARPPTAGPSAPGPSSRCGCTSPSACSARSASRRPCCSTAPWGTTARHYRIDIEHPGGHLLAEVELDPRSQSPRVLRAGVVRTARKLFDGVVYPRAARPVPRVMPGPFGIMRERGRMPLPPLHDVAHLGYVELLTPEAERSLWFFTQVLGLTEVSREGNSVYLRTWDDYERHTLKLTAHGTSGIRRVGLRAESQAALDRRGAAIEASGSRHRLEGRRSGIGATYGSPTRTGTKWSCTGRPSGTRRRRMSCGPR